MRISHFDLAGSQETSMLSGRMAPPVSFLATLYCKWLVSCAAMVGVWGWVDGELRLAGTKSAPLRAKGAPPTGRQFRRLVGRRRLIVSDCVLWRLVVGYVFPPRVAALRTRCGWRRWLILGLEDSGMVSHRSLDSEIVSNCVLRKVGAWVCFPTRLSGLRTGLGCDGA